MIPFFKGQLKCHLLQKALITSIRSNYSSALTEPDFIYVTGITGVKDFFLNVPNILEYEFLKVRGSILHDFVFTSVNTVTALV